MTNANAADVAAATCEGLPCTATFIKTRWQRVGGLPVEPTEDNVSVTATKPAGASVGRGAKLIAVERIVEERDKQNNRVIGGRCSGDCACVVKRPAASRFRYSSWTISVNFHEGRTRPDRSK